VCVSPWWLIIIYIFIHTCFCSTISLYIY
jgi:hypothetical protein